MFIKHISPDFSQRLGRHTNHIFNPLNPVDQYRYDKLSIVNITVNKFSGEGPVNISYTDYIQSKKCLF